MALSGSLNTNSYNGRYYKLSWTATQSIENNNSVISWKLEALGEAGAWYAERTLKVVIAGTTVFNKTDRVERYDGVIQTGTLTLNHDNEGNKSFAASVQAAVYHSTINCTGSANFTLNPIPRKATILTAPNFNDEENPTITYSNPAGNNAQKLQACISLTGAIDDIEYRDIPKTGTSYTFELNETERNILLKATANSNNRTVMFFVRTVIGGVTYHSALTKNFSVINANPAIYPFIADTNEVSKALTGNNTKFIKHCSNLEYTMGFECFKSATYKSCQITCGSETKTVTNGSFNNIDGDSITFSLIDSRDNTTTQTIDLDIVDYIKPTCSLQTSFDLETETTVKIKLKVTGKYYYGSFGATNNQLSLMYRYKVDSGEYGNWIALNPSSEPIYENNTYSINTEISGLSYLNTYTIQTKATDLINEIESNEEFINIVPAFDWGKEDFNFNVPIHMKNTPVMRLNDDGRLVVSGNEGDIYLRPNGSTDETAQMVIGKNGTVKINNETLADYIIGYGTEAMGSNGIWKIEYWASGKAVCYGVRNYGNMGVSTVWGNTHKSANFSQNFPSDLFIDVPEHLFIHSFSGGAALECCYGFHDGTTVVNKNNTGTFFFYTPNGGSGTISQVYVQFKVIGRWR